MCVSRKLRAILFVRRQQRELSQNGNAATDTADFVCSVCFMTYCFLNEDQQLAIALLHACVLLSRVILLNFILEEHTRLVLPCCFLGSKCRYRKCIFVVEEFGSSAPEFWDWRDCVKHPKRTFWSTRICPLNFRVRVEKAGCDGNCYVFKNFVVEKEWYVYGEEVATLIKSLKKANFSRYELAVVDLLHLLSLGKNRRKTNIGLHTVTTTITIFLHLNR